MPCSRPWPWTRQTLPALVRLGELYAARQDYHRARQYLRLALELDPSNAELAARLEGLNY